MGNNSLKIEVGASVFQDINAVGYRRLVANVSPNGSIIYKELDELANVIGVLTP